MDYDYDNEYFDEDGNVVRTSWGIEEEKELKRQQEEQERREHQNKLKEVDRMAAIDNKKSLLEEKIKRNQQITKLKDEWATMPKWIKELPRTPLSAPPTEGTSNKIKYKMTGKVVLTDNEKKKRTEDLKRLKRSIDTYRDIHQDIFERIMPVVSVIPTSTGSGATVVTRTMSKAISESRNDLGIVASIDLGTKRNELQSTRSTHLADWFQDRSGIRYMNLDSLLKAIRVQGVNEHSVSELFAKASVGEYYIVNSGGNSLRKVDPNSDDILTLYDFLNNTKNSGLALIECDALDRDSMTMAAAISSCCVFVVDVEKGSQEFVDFIRNFEKEINDNEIFEDILRNSVIIGNIHSKSLMTREGLKKSSEEMKKCSDAIGVDKSRTYLLPFEQGLVNPPLSWDKLSWSGKSSIRKMCGRVINIIKDQLDL